MTIAQQTQIERVEARVVALDEDGADDQAFGDALAAIQFLKEQIKLVEAKWKERAIQHIRSTGQPIVVGSVRWFLAKKKETKCRNLVAAIDALLTAAAGDMDLFCTTLSVNAVKHGAAKKILPPEAFEKCFEVVESDKLDSDGKPELELQNIDTRWLK